MILRFEFLLICHSFSLLSCIESESIERRNDLNKNILGNVIFSSNLSQNDLYDNKNDENFHKENTKSSRQTDFVIREPLSSGKLSIDDRKLTRNGTQNTESSELIVLKNVQKEHIKPECGVNNREDSDLIDTSKFEEDGGDKSEDRIKFLEEKSSLSKRSAPPHFQTIENYRRISRENVIIQSSGIKGFIRNTSLSHIQDTEEIKSDDFVIRKKRDDNDNSVDSIIVVEYLDATTVSDVYKFLHKYLKVLIEMRNVTLVMNDTSVIMNPQELCTNTWTEFYKNVTDDGQLYCNSSWDNFSCWPRTPAGSTATIRCPSYLAHINPAQNATKHCNENATWADKAVYDLCIENTKQSASHSDTTDSEAVRIIYNVGFSVSTLTLAVALFIFLYFRSLRCLRNSIHCHLIVTFIIKNIVWIIMWHSLVSMQNSSCTWCCKALTAIFNFAHATNFFWMFVEGLYLHIIIVWTYSADKIKLKYLLLIGWGLPSINIIAWVIVKVLHETKHDVCWLPSDDGNSLYDYIYIGPILFVLFANIIFLSTIVWVLITKLRASHSLETRQYRKAVKATIILFPLLGIIYVIFITPPSDHPKVHIIFTYINAVLQSFQGLLVAVFYCFLNGEVKQVLKKKLSRFNDARSLSTKYTRTSYNWTRNSRDFGNTTITLGNGALTEVSRTNHEDGKETPECIPLTDPKHNDKQHCDGYK